MSRDLIKIYSHPRSGTHFLEAFLSNNLYKGQNLSSNGPIYYGHWSNKIFLEQGEPYHQLFGSHLFPDEVRLKRREKKIYIYRDGRAVIYSIWKSKFYHKDLEGITFSEFLRTPLDWHGGIRRRAAPKYPNIVQHWYNHVIAWHNVRDSALLIIRFEDLKLDPAGVLSLIYRKFFHWEYIMRRIMRQDLRVGLVNELVGVKPNKGRIDSWVSAYSESDLSFFMENLPSTRFLHDNMTR